MTQPPRIAAFVRAIVLVAIALVPFSAFAAADVVTVGTATATSNTVDVPVSIRDVSGTPLGVDQPAGSKIQSFSIKVSYSPASAVSSVTFTRAGITAGLTPKSEFSPPTASSISLLDTFSEATNPIPFTLNASAPGNQVAHLVFTLSASAAPGSSITLTLDPSLTQLTDEGGTAATKETVSGGNLNLVNGSIAIPALTLALTPNPASVELNGTTTMTATLSANAGSTTAVALVSSSPSNATVPASVNIQAGSRTATFSVTGVALGSTTITATLPPSAGGATANASVQVVGPSITLSPAPQTITLGATATFTATMRPAQPTDTIVTLTAADATIVGVPGSIVVLAGKTSATFQATGLKLGTTTITARLPQAIGGRNSTAGVEVSSNCVSPDVPQLSVGTTSDSGVSYELTWASVNGATDYLVDESTDEGFANATTTTVTTTSATFTHASATDVRYYYRVRARNHGGACDLTSAPSTAVSILVKAGAVAAMRVIAVVGSTPGSLGSFFRTSVQLYNPKSAAVSGKIVYHVGGVSGSASDPALAYSLAPGKTLTYADLLPAIGAANGLGTVDLIADLTSSLPVTLVRIFNDAGAAGTSGMTIDPLRTEDALQPGQVGALLAPADMQKFRLNVGVRTLDQGAAMTITVRDHDGAVMKTVTKSYAATFFTQIGSAALLDGYTLVGGETISFEVTGGSAFIYGATTDNTTNDPSLQFARRND